ncbi:CaiB/BaiF CoA transferase family protein [Xanthobacter aminoxidans]|uniref:CaiB/BaiF CoA transferase family protein n=1 Tax=Xanthobacter aminoxidans TaxID=186280 RepID=UPI002023151E|nr:CoA transferase [Xanthobacter aminoxidans]MCL8383556.1 CoA transferase [Xanthobacter aminoxidans]
MLPLHRLPPAPDAPPCTLLAGVRVLDLTTSIAAPYATMLLADLGAEITKIERPGRGDDSRAWGPPFLDGESLWYLSVNRNKASVTLDYAQPEGLAVLHRLVAVSDVVVLNLVPRVQKKLKVDRETLRALNPNLVFVSITGFGLDGVRADKTSYDIVAEGFSGVMDLTGEPDSPPQKVGTPAADLLSGMDAVIGTLAALYDRAKNARGHTIDVSMFESMTRFLTPRVVTYLGSGEVPRRSGGKDSVIAIYQAFDTADDPITLGLGNDGLWRRFWEAIGDPAFGADPRFGSNADRHASRAEIVAQIQARLLTKPRAHWLDLFDAAGIPCGPINRIDQMVEDPELQARGFLYRMEDNGRTIPQVGLGIGIDGSTCGPRRAPPALGADTRDVLACWIGLDATEIDRLSRQGVI